MQDEYVKAFGKIEMDDKRKMEIRDLLANEPGQTGRKAKTTRLGKGAKAAVIAAAVTVTIGTLFIIPTTRNAISASVRSLFSMVIPEDAEDGYEKGMTDRDERVIPTDDMPESEAAEIIAAVTSQDEEEDKYWESVIVTADYYEDPTLNELANYYSQQGYNILDLEADSKFEDFYDSFEKMDWFSSGFYVSYHTGDNATGHSGRIIVFKATEEQLQGFLKNNYDIISYEREDHGQSAVSFDEFWSQSTDDEGNPVYTGSWTGPEPEVKLLPSDSARFMNFKVTYDTEAQVAVCSVEEGGGIG